VGLSAKAGLLKKSNLRSASSFDATCKNGLLWIWSSFVALLKSNVDVQQTSHRGQFVKHPSPT
jgi:hypothetical protein